MKIAFRCDASLAIGSGHVMRCLALADVLSAEGWQCHFLCRDHPGNLVERIAAQGHALHLLTAPAGTIRRGNVPYAAWLDVSSEQDALASRRILNEIAPDRVVVDHYALDASWEEAAVPPGVPVMVIDDLADRPHRCDVLLDQNLGRRDADYDGLVPDTALRLVSPRYALLRPEFAALRGQSLARREKPRLESILISMGGVDSENATGQVLDVLACAKLPEAARLTVVMGSTAPHLQQVQSAAAAMAHHTRVLSDVRDMANLMAEADLAIGAAGSTSWERCCLGLPSLLLVIAENQAPAAAALAASGAARLLGELRDDRWRERLVASMIDFSGASALAAMSGRAAALVDGLGTSRCRDTIAGKTL